MLKYRQWNQLALTVLKKIYDLTQFIQANLELSHLSFSPFCLFLRYGIQIISYSQQTLNYLNSAVKLFRNGS
jgi:flagellar assembly factor FliW